MWPVGCFGVPRSSFSGARAQQPRSSHRRRAHRRRRRSRAGRQPASARPQGEDGRVRLVRGSRDPLVLSGCRFPGLSSQPNEDENAKQQFNRAIPPCGSWGGNSKMPSFKSGCVITKMLGNSFLVKPETELSDSDDEGRLVIDLPPEVPNKKPRIRRKRRSANRGKELVVVTCAGKLHDDAVADILGGREEKFEEVTLQKNSKSLNELGKLGSVSPKTSKTCLPDVSTGILNGVGERGALTYTEDKNVSLAASTRAGMKKGILKQGNAEADILVKAFQECTTNEVYVKRRVTESLLCTGHSSKDGTAIGRPHKEIINTEESQSIEGSRGNDSAKETYRYSTYYLNMKESGLGSSTEEAEASGEDTGLSESDDPLEECQRIFDEFEREAQKKDHDKQVHNKNEMVLFKASPWQQHHNAGIQRASFRSPIFTWKRPSIPESGCKVPQETRQRYFTCFLTECVKTCSTVNEAINKTLIEEQSICEHCGNKKMYQNLAVKTLKRLRGQLNNSGSSLDTGFLQSEEEKGGALYELLKQYLLTQEQLNENNFPRRHPGKNGSAILASVKNAGCNAFRKVCCRCGEIYAVTSSGTHQSKEECNYHSGVLKQIVPGGEEKHYSCCERVVGSPGCQIAKLHVHDGRGEKLEGFMKTLIKSPPLDGTHDVYALNCEMCYTTRGLEPTRVTVVDPKLEVVYDAFVKPDGKVVDYDIRLSGVKESDLENTTTTLLAVQAVLLFLFSVDTILIGHNLENDLFALKLIHDMVVDTSIVFPHPLGLPHKRTLRSLTADYLWRIHQDDVYDSRENAIACMELILWKVREDNRTRK